MGHQSYLCLSRSMLWVDKARDGYIATLSFRLEAIETQKSTLFNTLKETLEISNY